MGSFGLLPNLWGARHAANGDISTSSGSRPRPWVIHPLGRRLFILPARLSAKAVRSVSAQSPRESSSQWTALHGLGPGTPSHSTSHPACERKHDLSYPVPMGTLGVGSCFLTHTQIEQREPGKAGSGRPQDAQKALLQPRQPTRPAPATPTLCQRPLPTAAGGSPAACKLKAKRQETCGCPRAPLVPFPS